MAKRTRAQREKLVVAEQAKLKGKRAGVSGWWGLGAIAAGALLGALIGGAIGRATYEPDPDCFVSLLGCDTQGSDMVLGAIAGTPFGAIAGLVMWGLWVLWVDRKSKQEERSSG